MITDNQIQTAASLVNISWTALKALISPLPFWKQQGILLLLRYDRYINSNGIRYRPPQDLLTTTQPLTALLINRIIDDPVSPPPPVPPPPRRIIKNPRPKI